MRDAIIRAGAVQCICGIVTVSLGWAEVAILWERVQYRMMLHELMVRGGMVSNSQN